LAKGLSQNFSQDFRNLEDFGGVRGFGMGTKSLPKVIDFYWEKTARCELRSGATTGVWRCARRSSRC